MWQRCKTRVNYTEGKVVNLIMLRSDHYVLLSLDLVSNSVTVTCGSSIHHIVQPGKQCPLDNWGFKYWGESGDNITSRVQSPNLIRSWGTPTIWIAQQVSSEHLIMHSQMLHRDASWGQMIEYLDPEWGSNGQVACHGSMFVPLLHHLLTKTAALCAAQKQF